MASDERHPLLDGAPLSLAPGTGEPAAVPEVAGDAPVLLLLGDGRVARAMAGLAAECGFVVDMAIWPENLAPGVGMPAEGEGEAAQEPGIPGVRRRILLQPGDSPVARCAIGRRHYVCIFPPGSGIAMYALEDVLASHAQYVGLWATRTGRERIWGELREAGVPDAELAAVSCPMGLGDLAINAPGPVPAAVAILAEVLAAQAGSRQRFRLED